MPLHCSVLEGLSLNDVSAIIRGMTFKQRSDGRFEGRLTLNGKRKSFYGTTKAEVKNKAKRYLMQIENGFKDPKKITFEEYAEYWFLTYKKGRIEPSSYTRLYRVFDAQLRDKIGSQKVGTITTQQLQKIIDEYANPSNGTEALSLSGLSKITQFLKSCFKSALKEEIISFNPAEDVLLPSKSYIAKETKQQFSLSDEEIERFRVATLEKLTNIDDYKSRNALVLLLILNLGLRAGEVLALKWSDIDFDNNLVYIRRTLQSGVKNENSKENGPVYTYRIKNNTKTDAGNRVLKLNDTVLFYLNEMKKYDIKHRISCPYVGCNKYGRINNHRNLQLCLDRLCKVAKITDKRVTLHTLRHTFGSTLIRRGVGIEVISKLMGHANITITYNKYIHTIKEEEAKTMDMIRVC